MRLLALLIALTTSNVFAEGFSAHIDIIPSTTVNQSTENTNNTDLDFFFTYINSYDHNFTLRPGFRYSDSTGETTRRDIRLRHRFTIAKIEDITFASDFRILFQGEQNGTKGFGEVNRVRFGPSIMYSTDVNSTSFYALYKPIMSHFFKDERLQLDSDSNTMVPVVENDVIHYLVGGFSSGRFSVEVGYGYQMKWNSQAERVDDGFELYEELVYAANDNLSFVLGHVSSGDLYNNDGRNNSINFVNPDGDFYYGKLVLKF